MHDALAAVTQVYDAPVSWRCRLVQLAMQRLIKPRLTLARGVAPLRRTLDRLAKLLPRVPHGVAIAPAVLDGVRGEWARSLERTTAETPVFLYFHGGAFVAGTPRLSRAIVAQLVRRCGGAAFSVDYRLAPEHPFPAALDDAEACYRRLLGDGITPARIVLAGESAGAALALGLALKMKSDAAARPRALVLISPWLDLSLSGASLLAAPDMDPGLPAGFMADARHMYLPGGRFDDPRASPLFAALDGLPPVLVQIGTREILLDDARRLAARLRGAGGHVRLEEWVGMHHVWQHAPIPEAGRAFAAMADFIAGVTAGDGGA